MEDREWEGVKCPSKIHVRVLFQKKSTTLPPPSQPPQQLLHNPGIYSQQLSSIGFSSGRFGPKADLGHLQIHQISTICNRVASRTGLRPIIWSGSSPESQISNTNGLNCFKFWFFGADNLISFCYPEAWFLCRIQCCFLWQHPAASHPMVFLGPFDLQGRSIGIVVTSKRKGPETFCVLVWRLPRTCGAMNPLLQNLR